MFRSSFPRWAGIAHDLYGGGGAPTLDFPVFCPTPLAIGASLVVSALGAHPFPGFGFADYVALAVSFGGLRWYFYRVGGPKRQRQLEMFKQQSPGAHDGEPGPAPDLARE